MTYRSKLTLLLLETFADLPCSKLIFNQMKTVCSYLLALRYSKCLNVLPITHILRTIYMYTIQTNVSYLSPCFRNLTADGEKLALPALGYFFFVKAIWQRSLQTKLLENVFRHEIQNKQCYPDF